MSGKRGADLPDPKWWKRARALKAEGYTNKDIGRMLNRSDHGVRYALDPEQGRMLSLRYPNRKSGSATRDFKRMHTRNEARARWRAEGRVRDLEHYYRDLECL